MQAVRSHRGPRPGRSQPFFPPLRAEELLGLERPQSWEGASQAPPPPRLLSPQSLELIRKHGFSAALFAPGWVYECLEKKDFFQNQDK